MIAKMRKQRKIISVILVILGLLLSACGKEQTVSGNQTVSQSQTETTAMEDNEISVLPEEGDTDEAVQTYMPENCVTVVYITINPRLALYLDEDQVIIEVGYLNDDAAAVFAEIELIGQPVEEGIEDIVETAIALEYLTDGKQIQIEVAGASDTLNEEMICEQIERMVTTTSENHEVEIIVSANVITENTESVTASENGAGAETGQEEAEEAQPVSVTCSACNGTGIVCSECGGTGIVRCKACNQTGYETCPTCGGSAVIDCHGCHGSGIDATSGEACRHCGGSGRITCDACHGSSSYVCTHCHGALEHVCPVCNGNKNCVSCGGTGVIEN